MSKNGLRQIKKDEELYILGEVHAGGTIPNDDERNIYDDEGMLCDREYDYIDGTGRRLNFPEGDQHEIHFQGDIMDELYNYPPLTIKSESSVAAQVKSETSLILEEGCAIYPGAGLQAPVISIKKGAKLGLGINSDEMEPEQAPEEIKELFMQGFTQLFGFPLDADINSLNIQRVDPPRIELFSLPSAFSNIKDIPTVNIENGVEFDMGKGCYLYIESINIKAHKIPKNSFVCVYQNAELGRVEEGSSINFLKLGHGRLPHTDIDLKEKYGHSPIKKTGVLKAKYLGNEVVVNDPESGCNQKVNSNIGVMDGAQVYTEEGNAKVREIKNNSYLAAANITITGIAANCTLDCPGKVVFEKTQHALNSITFAQKPASMKIAGKEVDVDKFWENYNSRIRS